MKKNRPDHIMSAPRGGLQMHPLPRRIRCALRSQTPCQSARAARAFIDQRGLQTALELTFGHDMGNILPGKS
jgi:hypothetical protein